MNSFNFDQQQQQQQQHNLPVYEPIWADKVLSDAEIKEIISLAESQNLQPAQVGNGNAGVQDNTIRRTLVSWLNPSNSPPWFTQRVLDIFAEANKQFNFELAGAEPAQYTKYDSEFRGEYKWHADIMRVAPNQVRKLSISILLDNPADYEGGNLILAPHGLPSTIAERKGRAIIFPSFAPHCVTPVIKGTRRSIVLWAHGPMFK
jgi:PKHD-type hydroxylase